MSPRHRRVPRADRPRPGRGPASRVPPSATGRPHPGGHAAAMPPPAAVAGRARTRPPSRLPAPGARNGRRHRATPPDVGRGPAAIPKRLASAAPSPRPRLAFSGPREAGAFARPYCSVIVTIVSPKARPHHPRSKTRKACKPTPSARAQ
jgi:hypothetical protein